MNTCRASLIRTPARIFPASTRISMRSFPRRKRACSARAGRRSSAGATASEGRCRRRARARSTATSSSANSRRRTQRWSMRRWRRPARPIRHGATWAGRAASRCCAPARTCSKQRKWDVSVACLIEVGKSRLEAVGEVEEAIDLIRHYCDEMERTDGFREELPGASSAERCSVVLASLRRVRRDRAVQFPGRAVGRDDVGGAGRRQHGGVQAERRGRADRPAGGRGARRRRAAGRRAQPGPRRPRDGRGAGPATREVDGFAFTGSNAVGMTHPAPCRGVARRCARCWPKWAARTRRSSPPAPTWRSRRPASRARRSGCRARNAAPRRRSMSRARRARRFPRSAGRLRPASSSSAIRAGRTCSWGR